MKTHKDRLEDLRAELEQYEARTPFELSAQVQALALCEIADEVIELVEHFAKYNTDKL